MQHFLDKPKRTEPSASHPSHHKPHDPQKTDEQKGDSFYDHEMLKRSDGTAHHSQGTTITIHKGNTNTLEPSLVNIVVKDRGKI